MSLFLSPFSADFLFSSKNNPVIEKSLSFDAQKIEEWMAKIEYF